MPGEGGKGKGTSTNRARKGEGPKAKAKPMGRAERLATKARDRAASRARKGQ